MFNYNSEIMSRSNIDNQNSQFWNELCGTSLASALGIIEISVENLRRFDDAYFEYYPYLKKNITNENLVNKKVLEIGLGFGTLGQFIATQNCDYYGLDIASNAVSMMNYRLIQLNKDRDINSNKRVQLGSALEIPYPDSCFDYVYSIGCLHHTGNLSIAIDEVYRVLTPKGKAIIMLYNLNSFRQFLIKIRNRASDKELVRAMYDANLNGESAPYTDYISSKQCRYLLNKFANVKIDIQNFDPLTLREKTLIERNLLLNNVGRLFGLELYINATK